MLACPQQFRAPASAIRTTRAKCEYGYDNADNRSSSTVTVWDDGDTTSTSRTEAYSYDLNSQLTGVTYGDTGTGSFNYDARGNHRDDGANPALHRVEPSGTTSWSLDEADGLNRLTSGSKTEGGQPPAAYTFEYDDLGNMTTQDTADSAKDRTYTWDPLNRLTQAVVGSTTVDFTYRPDGIRMSKASGGTTTRYLYAGHALLVEYTKDGSTITLKAAYMTGAHGIACRRAPAELDGQAQWYFYDGLGSVVATVRALIDHPGGRELETLASRKYDVWGSVRGDLGLSKAGWTDTSPHKFVGGIGHLTDSETGLIYMRARYYNPELGRFISQDPAAQGTNLFAYCGSNPVNLVDIDGKWAFLAGIFVSGLVSGLVSWGLSKDHSFKDFALGFASGAATAYACLGGAFVGAIAGALIGVAAAYLAGSQGSQLLVAGAFGAVGGFAGGSFVASDAFGLTKLAAEIYGYQIALGVIMGSGQSIATSDDL